MDENKSDQVELIAEEEKDLATSFTDKLQNEPEILLGINQITMILFGASIGTMIFLSVDKWYQLVSVAGLSILLGVIGFRSLKLWLKYSSNQK